ncbi:MAG: carbon-nitrogen hydrolase family protein [Gemmatimonadota bacterium]
MTTRVCGVQLDPRLARTGENTAAACAAIEAAAAKGARLVDGSFPESGRALRLRGAQLIVLPTNWPHQRLKRELVQIRAYENHVNYFAVNPVGVERGARFDGGSCAADPTGHLLAEGGDGPQRIHVDFDFAAADASRIVEAPGAYEYDPIADRRPDLYGPLTEPTEGGSLRTGSRLA